MKAFMRSKSAISRVAQKVNICYGLHGQAHLLLIYANRSKTVDNGLFGEYLRERPRRGICILRTGSRL